MAPRGAPGVAGSAGKLGVAPADARRPLAEVAVPVAEGQGSSRRSTDARAASRRSTTLRSARTSVASATVVGGQELPCSASCLFSFLAIMVALRIIEEGAGVLLSDGCNTFEHFSNPVNNTRCKQMLLVPTLLATIGPGFVFSAFALFRYRKSVSSCQFFFVTFEMFLLMFPFIVILQFICLPIFILADLTSKPKHADEEPTWVHNAIGLCWSQVKAFGVAGFAEECLKYYVLRRLIYSSRAADPAAVLVYGFAAGIGFALTENIDYTLDPINHRGSRGQFPDLFELVGLRIALMRMFSALPLHGTCAVLTALELSKAKFMGKGRRDVGCIWRAVLLHGVYDSFLMSMPYVPKSCHETMTIMSRASLPLGILWARGLMLELRAVGMVNIHECIAQGLVSWPRPTCCERLNCLRLATPRDQRDSFAARGLDIDLSGVVCTPVLCLNCFERAWAHKVLPSTCPFCSDESPVPLPLLPAVPLGSVELPTRKSLPAT